MASPTARELPITLDLPSSLYREIGKVIAAHSLIEWSLNRIVYKLLRIKPVEGRIAVRDTRTSDRLDMIFDLLKLNGLTISDDYAELSKLLVFCATQRDCLAHGVWVKDEAAGQIFLRVTTGTWQPPGTVEKSKRRIDLEAKLYDTSDARAVRNAVEATLNAIHEMGNEIDAALKSSRGKRRSRSRQPDRARDRKPKKPSPPPKSSQE